MTKNLQNPYYTPSLLRSLGGIKCWTSQKGLEVAKADKASMGRMINSHNNQQAWISVGTILWGWRDISNSRVTFVTEKLDIFMIIFNELLVLLILLNLMYKCFGKFVAILKKWNKLLVWIKIFSFSYF